MIFIIKGFQTIVFIFIVSSTMFQPICPPTFFRCLLSKFLRQSSMIFIIKGLRTIVFIFIVISNIFSGLLQVCRTQEPSRNFKLRPLLNPRGFACSDSVSHNWVQVLSIPVLLLTCNQDWTCNLQMIVSLEAQGTNTYNHYAMCPAEQFRVNFWDL